MKLLSWIKPRCDGVDAGSVILILVVGLMAVVFASWLGLAGLHIFVLKREGSAWIADARLWVRLRIAEYGLLLLVVGVAVAGVAPTWLLLLLAAPLVVLWFVRRRVRRRAEGSPGWLDQT